MKKSLFLSLFAGALLVGCGDSYDSVTIKQFFNEKSVAEQEKIGKYLSEKLPASELQKLAWLATDCAAQVVELQAKQFGKPVVYPEKCNQTLGEFIKSHKGN